MTPPYTPTGVLATGAVLTSRVLPGPALAPYVASYFGLTAVHGGSVRTVPEGCGDVIVDVSDAPRGWISGPRTTARVFEHAPGTRLFGVQLRPGAAHLLMDADARTLVDRSAPLSRDAFGELLDALGAARALEEAVPMFERFLGERLSLRVIDPRVVDAVDRIVRAGGTEAVETLAQKVGASPRNLVRLFVEWVGVTPKQLSLTVRFQRVLERAEGGAALDWAGLAADLGYADQGHLIRQFARFLGLTPSALGDGRSSP